MSEENQRMVRKWAFFPPKIMQRLDDHAASEGIGVAELLRRIVSDWLKKHRQERR